MADRALDIAATSRSLDGARWSVDWEPGEVIVERQIWHGLITAAVPTIVIESTPDHVVTFVAPGAPFGFVEDVVFPSPTGRHPRYGQGAWQGHGMLTITPRTGDFAVQHYWRGPDRQFACWYLNIQEPMRPTSVGFDSQDLELDILIAPDGVTWELKDDDILEQRIAEERWTADEIAGVRAIGARIVSSTVETGDWWWDRKWADWEPDTSMTAPEFPRGWDAVPVEPFEWRPG